MNDPTVPSARAFVDKSPIETPLREVRNPARTSEIVGYTAATEPEQVEQAIESSHRAGPQWAGLTLEERAAMIEAALPVMEQTLEERALILTREQGKVLWESVADCRGPAIVSQYFIDHAAKILATSRTVDGRGTTVKRHVPFGVTAVIVPWNYPVYLSFQHIIPALISGNTVIVKTPENAPLSLAMALEILMDCLPAGVLNVVPGSGSVVGTILSTHPKVRKVLFTGSLAVGRTILHAGADTIKSVGLELGRVAKAFWPVCAVGWAHGQA